MDWFDLVLAGLLLASLLRYLDRRRKYERALIVMYEQVRRLEDAAGYKEVPTELMRSALEAHDFDEFAALLREQLPRLKLPGAWKIEVLSQGSPYFSVASSLYEDLGRTVGTEALQPIRVDVGEGAVIFYLLHEPVDDGLRLELIGSAIYLGASKIRNSFVDGLTGLWSRGYLTLRLREEIQRAHRHRHWVSLVMVDSDHFKVVNDTYGHASGDQVIREIARLLQRLHHRGSDVVARFGGDEFLVLLPETKPEKAAKDAERIRRSLSQLRIPVEGASIGVTCSVGVYSVLPYYVETNVDEMLHHSDAALYEAKGKGRNCVVAYKDGSPRGNDGQ